MYYTHITFTSNEIQIYFQQFDIDKQTKTEEDDKANKVYHTSISCLFLAFSIDRSFVSPNLLF
jgi:hypothetical protein